MLYSCTTIKNKVHSSMQTLNIFLLKTTGTIGNQHSRALGLCKQSPSRPENRICISSIGQSEVFKNDVKVRISFAFPTFLFILII